ncbi:MAG: multicopper oxidase [Acidobacteriaceae bacterium]
MSQSRRSFLQQASAFGLAWSSRNSLAAQMMEHGTLPMPMSMAGAARPSEGSGPLMLHSLELTPFVDELPLPQRVTSVAPHGLRIAMREIHAKVHRDVPSTRMWSYGPTPLAPLIEARSDQPLRVEWVNRLPLQHFLPIDHSLPGCGPGVPDVRAVVHMHGAKAATKDDGYPEDWFVPGQSSTCHYPMQQEAAMLWYHDHAMGINRLNIYAGLAGMMLIRDRHEDALDLPSGTYEIPLTFYDRNFSADGQLFYPTSGDPEHPWVPEFAGDAILLNGKIRPYLDVEPRLYRFRVLNAANSRFLALSLGHGQPFHQIGSDQGLLSAPVQLTYLNLAPAERADLLIDFSHAEGQNLHLLHGAFEILQFRVARKASAPARSQVVPAALRPVVRTPDSASTVTRTILLNEQLNGVGNSMRMLINHKRWHEPVTEQPRIDTTEIWEFVNLTEDTHPMHLHLVRFQVLDRRLFDVFAYQNSKNLRYLAAADLPEANEMGWKDTVQCPPGMITRIIVRFEGFTGKYLYHCHILEHESNDMMRPFEVIA